MITDAFDDQSPAIIQQKRMHDAPKLDAVIVTFSFRILEYVKEHYPCYQITELTSVAGSTSVYGMEYQGKNIGFYKTYVGGPVTVGWLEELLTKVDVDKIILFGGAGCLDKEIAMGKIMVPTAAYRDEGTSYHYVPAADYIPMENSWIVADFMAQAGIPYVLGKTWTTDAFYRETRNNFEKRKAEGCIAVEMEVASVQAMCDFRGISLYSFLKSGDLLDAPQWDPRKEFAEYGSQHDPRYFEIALALACYAVQ